GYALDQSGEVVVGSVFAEITHQDSVMPPNFASIMDVHDGQLQCFGEVLQRQTAHVPLVSFSPNMSRILDHVRVRRMPPDQVGFISKKTAKIITQQIEALVKIGAFESNAEFIGYINAGAS